MGFASVASSPTSEAASDHTKQAGNGTGLGMSFASMSDAAGPDAARAKFLRELSDDSSVIASPIAAVATNDRSKWKADISITSMSDMGGQKSAPASRIEEDIQVVKHELSLASMSDFGDQATSKAAQGGFTTPQRIAPPAFERAASPPLDGSIKPFTPMSDGSSDDEPVKKEPPKASGIGLPIRSNLPVVSKIPSLEVEDLLEESM
jgi:hypothetical protein